MEKKKIKVNNLFFKKKCNEFYKDKTYERVTLAINKNPDIDKIKIINNLGIPSIYKVLKKVEWKILENGKPVNFHGDLQPENIIVTKDNKFKLIDWRTDFSGVSYGDIYYEFSKLNHMLTINTKNILDGKFSVVYQNDYEVKYNFQRENY